MYDFATPVTEDLILYAYWTENLGGFAFQAIGIVKDSDGYRKINVRSSSVYFEYEYEDIDVFVSPFYTDKYFTELADGELEKGTEYYFYITLEDVEGVEGKPLVYFPSDIIDNLDIYSAGGDIVATELSHSPGGKYATILFKYVLDEAYEGAWVEINHKWYFVEPDGDLATGWENVGGRWYYFNVEGIMQTGWLKLDGAWYYLEGSGAMATGWKGIDGNWYCFASSGVMMTGWFQEGSTWYYMEPSGAMVTGWKQIGGKWYFFEKSGAMKTGWLQEGSNWYYLKPSGEMATGTVKIGNTEYRFTDSGIWIED